MTAVASRPAPVREHHQHHNVDLAVARHAFRQVWIGASVCALAFGGTAAASALSYVSSFSTEASRQQILTTTGNDRGLQILLGPVSALDTVGGYTVYKGFVFLTTISALWAMLAATRILRGEEDAGRWQLVLAGRTRPARATAAVLGALALAVGVILVGTTLITLLAALNPDVGFAVGDTILYGLSIAMPAAVFAGVGAVTAQLCRNRRAANSLSIAVFAITFVLRMIADSGSGAQWLRWLTPFGWTELVQPFTKNDVWPLLPGIAATLVLGAAAVTLSSRRDVGDGVFASPDVAPARAFGLGSAPGLAARLELIVLGAWCVGAAASGLVLGVIAKVTTTKIPASLSDAIDKFGVHGSFANQYLGVAFLLVATVVALVPAGQVAAACAEETSGRLALVLASPTRRTTWFVSRLALAGAAVVGAGLLAGFGAWLGAISQGVDLDLVTMVGAGLNVVPIALVVLGIGALVLAIAPRAAAATVYGVVIWSLLIDLLASTVSNLGWLDQISLFHYLALAPAVDPTVLNILVTMAIALVLMVAATAWFGRRDLAT